MLDKTCDAISSDEAVTNSTGVLDISDATTNVADGKIDIGGD